MKRWVLAMLLVAGCTSAPEATTTVEPLAGGGHALCPPHEARAIALPFRVNQTRSDDGLGEGLHRLSEREFLWVFAAYESTLRQDRITRVNPVHVARDGHGVVHVCTRVDIASPLEVDAERESYVVAARLTAGAPLPEGPLRVVVNWVAGCRCDPLPMGNTTALFE